MKTKTRKLTKALKILGILLLTAVAAAAGIDCAVILKTRDRILEEDKANLKDADCILVLGAGVRADGTPSHMLTDRLIVGIRLYERGAAPKLLMSGDHGQEDYDEVNTMKAYAVSDGVLPEDVFMDHAGFSTYESLIRARDVFGVKRVIIVTQTYHLYRALWLAEALGMEAVGVSADLRTYIGQSLRDTREVAARCKDFIAGLIQPKPSYGGASIDIHGDGGVTDDKIRYAPKTEQQNRNGLGLSPFFLSAVANRRGICYNDSTITSLRTVGT